MMIDEMKETLYHLYKLLSKKQYIKKGTSKQTCVYIRCSISMLKHENKCEKNEDIAHGSI